MAEQHFAYVPHHRQKEFEALGWVFDTDLGYPHAAYASYYKWPVELGEVRYPGEQNTSHAGETTQSRRGNYIATPVRLCSNADDTELEYYAGGA